MQFINVPSTRLYYIAAAVGAHRFICTCIGYVCIFQPVEDPTKIALSFLICPTGLFLFSSMKIGRIA
ncbi:hypothetical protein F4810DRAFT_694144 [Camillea tinctor]|nr:hypothetical protein F4810DRAFT_694144 [Camillea tinctor]